jgi:hypothetical protein
MDGDGDMDVASRQITKSPGTKTTASRPSPAIPSPQMQMGPNLSYAADMDGDGDMDVLSASYSFG